MKQVWLVLLILLSTNAHASLTRTSCVKFKMSNVVTGQDLKTVRCEMNNIIGNPDLMNFGTTRLICVVNGHRKVVTFNNEDSGSMFADIGHGGQELIDYVEFKFSSTQQFSGETHWESAGEFLFGLAGVEFELNGSINHDNAVTFYYPRRGTEVQVSGTHYGFVSADGAEYEIEVAGAMLGKCP